MDKMKERYTVKAKSAVKNPQVLNGLAISVFVYWVLWVSSSLVIHLVNG